MGGVWPEDREVHSKTGSGMRKGPGDGPMQLLYDHHSIRSHRSRQIERWESRQSGAAASLLRAVPRSHSSKDNGNAEFGSLTRLPPLQILRPVWCWQPETPKCSVTLITYSTEQRTIQFTNGSSQLQFSTLTGNRNGGCANTRSALATPCYRVWTEWSFELPRLWPVEDRSTFCFSS